MELTDLQLPTRTPQFLEWDPAILDVLAQPLPPELIHSFNDTRTGNTLSYIKWKNIEDVLNTVVPGWSFHETRESVGKRWIHLYGYIEIYGVKRFNVGYFDSEAPNQIDGSGDSIAPATIARASLLRRCAASFGLGSYLYLGDDPKTVPQVSNRYALRTDQAKELGELLLVKDIPTTVAEQIKAEKSWTISKANKYIVYLRHRPVLEKSKKASRRSPRLAPPKEE